MNKLIKKYGQFVMGAIFLLYVLYTFFNALDIGKEVVIATFLTIVIYLQSVGELLYFYKKKGKPRLQDWMRLALFIVLVLNFMKIVNNADGSLTVKIINNTVSLNDSPFTMIVIIFALLSLDIAYLLSKTFKKPKASNKRHSIKRRGWIFGILIFSTAVQSYFLFSGISGFASNIEYSYGIFSLVKILTGILNPFALIISAYIIFIENSHNRKYQIIFYSALLIQVLLGLMSGMKESTLTPIFYVGVVFLIAGWKLPKKLIYTGVIIVTMLYPLNNAYRTVISDPYLNTGSHILNMAIAMNMIINEPLWETLSGGIESYEDRGAMFPFLQYSINSESSWNYYKNMTRYAALPIVWLIPSAIWPDKPRADMGGALYEKIVGVRTKTAVTPTSIGWAYLEGGLLFVVLIFILLGLLFEFIDKRNHTNPIALIFYIIILHKAIKPEWDPYFMIASMIQMYIMYWILLKFIGVKKKAIYNES